MDEQSSEAVAVDRRARREVRPVPLVFGVAFVVLGVTALVAEVDEVDLGVAWLWVVALAALGIGGLIASLDAIRRSRRASR